MSASSRSTRNAIRIIVLIVRRTDAACLQLCEYFGEESRFGIYSKHIATQTVHDEKTSGEEEYRKI